MMEKLDVDLIEMTHLFTTQNTCYDGPTVNTESHFEICCTFP